jgi:hypothetical protein
MYVIQIIYRLGDPTFLYPNVKLVQEMVESIKI